MADLKVNAEAVKRTATNLKKINNQMRSNIQDAQNAITSLDKSWDGSAATNTIRKFNEIRTQFGEARYQVMDNYINFLLHQVGEGYETTESANKSLADAFK